MKNRSTFTRLLLLLLAALTLSGCAAGRQTFQTGQGLMEEGEYAEAIAHFSAALEASPETDEYRTTLARARTKAGWAHLEEGREYFTQGDFSRARAQFMMALDYDPTLEAAATGIRQSEERLRAMALYEEAESFYRQRRLPQARLALDEALLLAPDFVSARELLEQVRSAGKTRLDGYELDVASDTPITLKFKDAQIRDVFNILSKLSGINFLFDEDLKDQKVSVLLEDASFAQALELLLKMNDLGKRVLNGKTVIIYSNTKDKEKQYQDQIIQTFYLSNIDAKKAVNLLRTMLQLRKIYVHEELNALVIRDNPEVIKLAQQIIESADRADAEVLYELELVEISHSDDLTVGPKLQSYSSSFGFVNPGSDSIPSNVTVSGSPGNLDFLYTVPTATFDYRRDLTDSEILANPQIRVKNKEKAKVHVGSREPVITVTTTGTSDTRSDSVQYVDVGVKLEIEPTIQLDNTVVSKVSLEVSNVTDRFTTTNGTVALTISTTNANTALTLKDGETTVLGGLIRDDYSKTRNTLPLLGRLPLIGPLLSGHQREKTKREILLSITPHIVKSLTLPRADVAQIWSGGEDDLKAGPNFAAFAEPLVAEQERPAPLPAPSRGGAPALPALEATGQADAPVQQPVQQPAVPVPQKDSIFSPMEPPPQPPAEPPTLPSADGPVPEVEMPQAEAAPAATGAKLFLRGPALATVGEEFAVEVAVDGFEDLFSAPFFVSFSPELLSFQRAVEGDFLGRQGGETIFTSSVNQDQGQLIVGTKQGSAGQGAGGSGQLATLYFKALAPGAARLDLERINFRDPEGNRLPVSAGGLSVEVR